MRVFVALNIPQRTKDNLQRSSAQFAALATKGNFVPKDNYHITLHFLGDVAPNNLIYIQSAMDSVKDFAAPQMAVSQFTVLRASNVVCAKFKFGDDLVTLHEQLANKLEKSGFTLEHRAYRPHVTLIRNFAFELPFSEVTKSVDVYNKPFAANEVVLYESTLTSKGAVYTELYRVVLPVTE